MSYTTYSISVGSPTRAASGVNVTKPLESTLHTPSPVTVSVFSIDSVEGSRSTLLASTVPSGSLSIPCPLSSVTTFSVTEPMG